MLLRFFWCASIGRPYLAARGLARRSQQLRNMGVDTCGRMLRITLLLFPLLMLFLLLPPPPPHSALRPPHHHGRHLSSHFQGRGGGWQYRWKGRRGWGGKWEGRGAEDGGEMMGRQGYGQASAPPRICARHRGHHCPCRHGGLRYLDRPRGRRPLLLGSYVLPLLPSLQQAFGHRGSCG